MKGVVVAIFQAENVWIGHEIGLCFVTKNLILEGGLELDKMEDGSILLTTTRAL
jgi:hypothetical protein